MSSQVLSDPVILYKQIDVNTKVSKKVFNKICQELNDNMVCHPLVEGALKYNTGNLTNRCWFSEDFSSGKKKIYIPEYGVVSFFMGTMFLYAKDRFYKFKKMKNPASFPICGNRSCGNPSHWLIMDDPTNAYHNKIRKLLKIIPNDNSLLLTATKLIKNHIEVKDIDYHPSRLTSEEDLLERLYNLYFDLPNETELRYRFRTELDIELSELDLKWLIKMYKCYLPYIKQIPDVSQNVVLESLFKVHKFAEGEVKTWKQ